MTVSELISILKDEEPGAEVYLGIQPAHAIKCGIDEVVRLGDRIRDEDDRNDDDHPDDVYILQADQLGYANGKLWS